MTDFRAPVRIAAIAFPFVLGSPAVAGAEIRGVAILDHPCGKVAVQQMALVHAGKMDEANQLTTREMRAQWRSTSAKDRAMMTGMMKEMSQTAEKFAADIKTAGLLEVDGPAATLTVEKKMKDANGSSSTTTTQKYRMDGGQCLITR